MNRPAKPASEIARSEPISRSIPRDADRALRLLLTSAMVATVAIFGTVSYLSYRQYAATVTGLTRDAILWGWVTDMSSHLIFGVSATLAHVRGRHGGVAAHAPRGASACPVAA